MISFQLASMLKERGFPQPEEPTTGHFNSWVLQTTFGSAYYQMARGEVIVIRLAPGISYARESVFIPGLSDLINACAEKLDVLEQHDFGAVWVAKSVRWTSLPLVCDALTPEEAVAKLFLKLDHRIK